MCSAPLHLLLTLPRQEQLPNAGDTRAAVLRLVNEFRAGSRNAHAVHQEVSVLLRQHPEVQNAFLKLLPRTRRTAAESAPGPPHTQQQGINRAWLPARTPEKSCSSADVPQHPRTAPAGDDSNALENRQHRLILKIPSHGSCSLPAEKLRSRATFSKPPLPGRGGSAQQSRAKSAIQLARKRRKASRPAHVLPPGSRVYYHSRSLAPICEDQLDSTPETDNDEETVAHYDKVCAHGSCSQHFCFCMCAILSCALLNKRCHEHKFRTHTVCLRVWLPGYSCAGAEASSAAGAHHEPVFCSCYRSCCAATFRRSSTLRPTPSAS